MTRKTLHEHFYHSIVSMDALRVRLDLTEWSDEEKATLMDLAERTLHHSILDLVLSELSDQDKRVFLEHHAHERHKEAWSLLRDRIESIEDKIKKTADEVAKKLHADLKKAQRS